MQRSVSSASCASPSMSCANETASQNSFPSRISTRAGASSRCQVALMRPSQKRSRRKNLAARCPSTFHRRGRTHSPCRSFRSSRRIAGPVMALPVHTCCGNSCSRMRPWPSSPWVASIGVSSNRRSLSVPSRAKVPSMTRRRACDCLSSLTWRCTSDAARGLRSPSSNSIAFKRMKCIIWNGRIDCSSPAIGREAFCWRTESGGHRSTSSRWASTARCFTRMSTRPVARTTRPCS